MARAAEVVQVLAPPAPKQANPADLRVTVEGDGSVVIHAPAEAAALLAGRIMFGDLPAMQASLEGRIADAWYAADCPKAT